MKQFSDNSVENALLNDAQNLLLEFEVGDPGKHVQTLIPAPEWKELTKQAQMRGISLSLMTRIALRQHLVWLSVHRSPADIG